MTVVIHAGYDGRSLFIISGYFYSGARVRELLRGNLKAAVQEFANEKFIILCDGTDIRVVDEVYKYMKIASVRVRAIGTSQFLTRDGFSDIYGYDVDMLEHILNHADHAKFPVGLYINRVLTPAKTEAELHDILLSYRAESTVKEIFIAGHMDMSPRTLANVSYFDIKRSTDGDDYDKNKVYPVSTLTTHICRAISSPLVSVIALLVGIFWSICQIWGSPSDIPEPSDLAWNLMSKTVKKGERRSSLKESSKSKRKKNSCIRFFVKAIAFLTNLLCFPFIMIGYGIFLSMGNSFYTFVRSGSVGEVTKECQVIVVNAFRAVDERYIATKLLKYPVAPWYSRPRAVLDSSSHLPMGESNVNATQNSDTVRQQPHTTRHERLHFADSNDDERDVERERVAVFGRQATLIEGGNNSRR